MGVKRRYVQVIIQPGLVFDGMVEQLRLSLLITASSRGRAESTYRSEYAKPSIFLTSLPKLASKFLRSDTVAGRYQWPGASRGNKRKRKEEGRLLGGMNQGLKVSRHTKLYEYD
jgi:hypothetical protein